MFVMIFMLLLFSCVEVLSFSITNTPICSVYTPDSILNKKENYLPLFVGDRTRYSTCTGVAWFHGNYLAVLNLYGRNIRTYEFNEETEQFSLVQHISNKDGAQLCYSENLAVCPDGTLLAVCYNFPPGINIYAIDLSTHLINPKPIYTIKATDLVHRVRFSPDGSYLAYVTFDKKESIIISKIYKNKKNSLGFKNVCKKENNFDVKAKSIGFTSNNQFIVVAYCLGVDDSKQNRPQKNILVSYKFDDQTGMIGSIVSLLEQDMGTEDIAFVCDDTVIVATNQNKDELIVYSFNPETGSIADNYRLITDAQLSFPHGIAVSHDEKYMVVTSYGDDKFNLYQIED